MEHLFFELIRVAIGTQNSLSRQLKVNEWERLYQIAHKQSLIGICFAALQKLGADADEGFARIGMSEMLYLTWMGMAVKIQQRNEIVNRQCVEVQQLIEKGGFRTFIMKGQGNAALYVENLKLLRQSGDIDIYLDGGFEKVNDFVQRTCPTKEINELEIHYHCLEDTEVEIHYRPFILRNPIKNAKLQKIFKEVISFDNKIAMPNNVGCINVPTPEFNLIHQMVHIAHHLYTDGIGFRQLMDYYFVLKSLSDSSLKARWANNVKNAISKIGLNTFASALMWVLGYVFGLQKKYMLWEPCEKDGMRLLEEILKSGNFGHQDETKADLSNEWLSFWYVNCKAIRFWRFDRWAWFWSPLWRTYHFAWRKINGYK